MPSSEAEIHFELYRHLKNSIEENPEYHGVKFSDVSPEKNVDGSFADIVVEDRRGDPFLVIEAKRDAEGGGYNRNLDPYSPEVIRQASRYAYDLGSRYFATYNGSQLVLFRTHERGVPLLERQARAYDVKNPEKFAPELLEQVAGIDKKKVGWEPKSRTFIKRLKSFHERLTQDFEKKIEEKLDEREFKKDFNNWINKQGWDIGEDEEKKRFVNQAAYLLMNKLFFYKVLEDTGHEVPDLPLEELNDPERRREAFDRIIEEVDFEPIYEHDPIFDELPLTERGSLEVGEFLEELDRYDFDEFKHDTIGHIYEDIIPPEVRHDLGQYYTPPEIVELINELTIENPDDEILDPGCGSGTFLITAYNILRELKEDSEQKAVHTEILDQLHGIDINRFPAHLTAINLALQDLGAKTEEVNVEVQDFFYLRPYQDRIGVDAIDTKTLHEQPEGGWEFNIPPKVDVVVANPPYIRQEIIPDKSLCRKHLERLGYGDFSERADIYAYFFTHATEFLREGGRVGFITSDKWLTVGYGEDLQDFFLDNYKIKAIISFSKRVFEDPLVPTCVTILDKTDSKTERDSNIVKFLRIKTDIELEEIIDLVESNLEQDILEDKEDYRLITKRQGDLREAEKWNRFLYAPSIYWKLLNHEKICKLGDIAEVRRGITSGANDFFYLKKDEVEDLGIDDRFLRPVAKSIRQTDTIEFTEEDTNILVLDAHDYVSKKLEDISSERIEGIKLDKKLLPRTANVEELSPEEEYILNSLQEDGYERLFQYIVRAMWEKDWGRYNPPQKRPTCRQYRKQNGCWFDLGELREPDLIIAKGYWKDIFVPLNSAKAVVDCRIYEAHASEPKVLAGILNSDLIRMFRELHCRITGGGMSEMMVYETEELPILNPELLGENEKEDIKGKFREILQNNEIRSKNLDKAVLSPLKATDYAEKISSYTEALSKARREGIEVSEMISGLEEGETEELEGAEIVSEGKGQQKIDEF